MRVLVADDDSTMRTIIVRSLNSAGVTDVVEVGDGQVALDRFFSQPFDLLLTERELSGRSGVEVVREIRASGATTPIMMVTREAEKSAVLDAIQAGVTDYLVMPFTADSLREKIERMKAAREGGP